VDCGPVRQLLNNPYDGFDTGTHLGDAMRRIEGIIYSPIISHSLYEGHGALFPVGERNTLPPANNQPAPQNYPNGIGFDSAAVVPTANEFRVASLSVEYFVVF